MEELNHKWARMRLRPRRKFPGKRYHYTNFSKDPPIRYFAIMPLVLHEIIVPLFEAKPYLTPFIGKIFYSSSLNQKRRIQQSKD